MNYVWASIFTASSAHIAAFISSKFKMEAFYWAILETFLITAFITFICKTVLKRKRFNFFGTIPYVAGFVVAVVLIIMALF